MGGAVVAFPWRASSDVLLRAMIARHHVIARQRGRAHTMTSECARPRILVVRRHGGITTMAADFRIRPLADRVVVKPADREAQTKGGIFLPDTASKERPMEGTVLAVGEGRLDDNA